MPDQPQPAVIPVPAVEPAEPIEPAERTALIHPDRHAIIRRLLTALRSHLHRHQALFIGSLAGGGMLVAGFCSVA